MYVSIPTLKIITNYLSNKLMSNVYKMIHMKEYIFKRKNRQLRHYVIIINCIIN